MADRFNEQKTDGGIVSRKTMLKVLAAEGFRGVKGMRKMGLKGEMAGWLLFLVGKKNCI